MATMALPQSAIQHRLRAVLDDGLQPVLGGLTAIFLAINLILPELLSGGWNLYLAQPLLWGSLGVYCLTRPGFNAPRLSPALVGLALLCGMFQAGVLLGAGMLYGFGYSGYAHSADGIAANLWYLSAMLFGAEMARSFLLQRLTRHPVAAFFSVAVLFGLLNLSLDQLGALSNGGRATLMLGGERLLPSIASSLLATLLSALGGPWSAVAYRGSALLFEWLSPVLPNLPWLPAAIAGSIAPGVAFSLVQSMTAPEEQIEASERSRSHRFGWVLPFALAIAVAVWFNTGLLGVQPAVVSGISMEPNLRLGDIVVTRHVDPSSVRVGDVIKFRSGQVSILHRVVEVRSGAEGSSFITRGDNNNYLDAPVPESSVEGRVVLVVPKLGLLPIAVKNWLAE